MTESRESGSRPEERDGVLPNQQLHEMLNQERIFHHTLARIPPDQVQPASLDLTIGSWAARLRCSFLPMGEPAMDRLEEFQMERLDLTNGAVLEVNRPYLAPVAQALDLPDHIRAQANPRSSTGRLDIFTRVIADHAHEFDSAPAGYRGRVCLEIISRTFTVKIAAGISLNQIRLMTGNPTLSPEEMLAEHRAHPLASLDGRPMDLSAETLRGGLPLSVDLIGNGRDPVGFRAKRNSRLLDLTSPDPQNQEDFWEPIRPERGGRIVLEPEEFYILASRESVCIPPHLAAEMVALDPRSGEFRTHYAGFFDPGFGHQAPDTRAVMEIRAHDVPFALQHGQRTCRLSFERLLEPAKITYGNRAGPSYQGQGVQLSRHFTKETG